MGVGGSTVGVIIIGSCYWTIARPHSVGLTVSPPTQHGKSYSSCNYINMLIFKIDLASLCGSYKMLA